MTAYDKTQGGSLGHPSRTNAQVPYVVDRVLDFSAITNVSGDTFKVFTIPAGSVCIGAGIEVITAGTGSGKIALGDGTSVFVAAVAPTSTGYSGNAAGTNSVYSAAGALTITTSVANDVNAKVRVWAVLVDVTRRYGPEA